VGLPTGRRSGGPLTRVSSRRGSSLRVQTAVAVLTVAFLAGMPWSAELHGAAPVVAASATCRVSSAPPPAIYTVTVCIVSPSAGATVTGSKDVTATLNVSGTSPGFQRATFTLDGLPLLTDYVSPYTFKLDSRRWGDGTHALALTALMRDGFTSAAAIENLTFSNGQASPPPNPRTFVPATPSPAAGAPLVVAATGDGASGEPSATGTVNLISSWSPNMFLYLGDVYEKGRAMEFDNWYGQPGAAGVYGQFRAYTNPTIGNHEYEPDGAPGYFYYWDNIPHYYSYNAGGWHFISLDSTSQYNQLDPSSAQYQWLQADLAANQPACTLVYFHHPLFNVGPEGKTTALAPVWSLLAANHVTLVVNGHDHDYQRYEPLDGAGSPSATGITEIVVGSGGHGHQDAVPGAPDAAHLVASDFSSFGAVKFNLYPTSAAFTYVSTAGEVIDSGLVPCRNTIDTVAPTAPTSLRATAAGSGEIDLTWGAATDAVGVAGYNIFRDGAGSPLATVEPGLLSYADTSVAPNTTHSYTVVAFDAAGNRSPAAGPKSATTSNGTTTITLNPVADSYTNTGSPTTNYGSSVSIRVGTTVYRSYLRFDLTGVSGTIQSADLKVYANSAQSVGYSAYGVANTTWGESTINASNQPPFAATASGASGPILLNTWTSVGVTGLAAAAEGGLLSVGLATTASQVNLASRESANKPQLVLTIGGAAQKPKAQFTASATSTIEGVPISFTDTSTNAPTAWNWTFDDGTTSHLQNPSHSWAQAGIYTVGLVAFNSAGASTPATKHITVNDDLVAPSTPTGLAATPASQTEIDLAWGASTDNVAVTGYEVFSDGSTAPLATTSPGTLTYADTGLAAGSTHSYTVLAVDGAGNRSVAAGPVSATTASGAPTTVTLNPVADSYTNTGSPATNYGTNISLRVGTSVFRSYLRFDLTGISGTIQSAALKVYANSAQSTGYSVYRVADTTWGESTITATNQPAFAATASGASGAILINTWTSVGVTSLATAAEGSLLSMGLSTTGSQTNLASRESANKPELVLTILGGGSPPPPPPPPTASFTSSATTITIGLPVSFTDTSAGSPTSWSWSFGDGTTSVAQNPSHTWSAAGPYTVSLVASNASGSSAPATTSISVTADTTPPTDPTNFSATANGSTKVDLAWGASTDNVGVTGYEIFRDGSTTPLASPGPTAVSYQDTGLSPNTTYSYTIWARDAATNTSHLVGPRSATTGGAGTTTVVLNPVADAYVNSASPGTNYGTNVSIRVSGGSSIMRPFLRFDLTGITGTIQSATLKVFANSAQSTGYSVYRVADTSWGELTITDTNAPPVDASASGASGPILINTWTSVDVLSLAGPAKGGLMSVALKTTGSQTNLASRETATQPQLVLTVATP
jgi:PKD repeat protein